MVGKKYIQIFTFLITSIFSFGQDTISQKQKFKVSEEFYPSVSFMYGLLYYHIETGDKNSTQSKYYNQNLNAGVQLNADMKLAPDFIVQIYVGYNHWNNANLFPIGIMIKPKINTRKNELYFKLGGGYSFGKRYDDPNEKWDKNIMPSDYGQASAHGQIGLEKNVHLSSKKVVSIGFLVNIQLIKSYYPQYSHGNYPSGKFSYLIPYKFAGLTIAYHFY